MTRPFLGFPPATFADRRARAIQALEGSALILPAAPILKRSRDTEHRYRPDAELFYLTGCVDPGVVAVLRDSEEDRFSLFMPPKDPKEEIWFGPRMDLEEARELYGADSVHALGSLEDRVPGLLRSSKGILFRLGSHSRLEALVMDALRWARTRGATKGDGPRALRDPGEILDPMRLIKEPEEVSRIRKAASLTVEGFGETLSVIEPGMGEWEVEAILESAFRRKGARGPAFPTIVASGKNGCTLHYIKNHDTINRDDLVILDGGAEVDLYTADMTRTYPAGGRFREPQLDLYRVVLRAHEAASSRVRSGSTLADVHQAAVEELTEGLAELGVLKGEVGELLEEGSHEAFYPHRTSHWLGLDVHDVGDYASGGGPRVLQPGMVLTVEPGLYFPPTPDGPSLPYTGMGVRIEDELLVTDEGVENLTGALPVAPQEVEELVGSAIRE